MFLIILVVHLGCHTQACISDIWKKKKRNSLQTRATIRIRGAVRVKEGVKRKLEVVRWNSNRTFSNEAENIHCL